MRTATRLLLGCGFVLCLALLVGFAPYAAAQVVSAEAALSGSEPIEQVSYTTSGSYFNRELGTPLRATYHTEGYGTQTGVVSLGSMKVFNLDGATWFLDGQGTMSDSFGGGFNFGVGYRELVTFDGQLDPERILGASFWTDGQSTESENWFTQLGFALESLGESYDLRLNGYFPLSETQTGDPVLIDFDTPNFSGNELFAGMERYTIDTAHSVIDGEFAKRIGNLDAWATAGVYQMWGGDDATGYRLGFRGYALPDLMVSLQATDDDLYNTNVMFGITWFVGRTNRCNAPIGTIVDRFREPVMRNDFIATTSVSRTRGAGDALTDADNNELFHFIHVNSNAAAGGDGTFEKPFQTLELAEAAQQDGAYVYVHGGSTLAPTETFTFLDNVKLWGEGTDQNGDVINHVVDSVERGSLTLPETAIGASALAAAIINASGAGTDLFVLADNNKVNNFAINNGNNIVVADGVNAPELGNLDINNPTGTAIRLTDVTGTPIIENTVTIDGAGTGIHIDGGSDGMNLAAQITDTDGSSLIIENRTGGTIAFGGSINDGAADTDNADAIIIRNNVATTVSFSQTLNTTENLGINIDAGNQRAVFIDGNDVDSGVAFADLLATSADANTVEMQEGGTLTINDSAGDSLISNTGTGDAVNLLASGADTELSTVTVNANIENLGAGNAVDISGWTANNATFNGTVNDGSSTDTTAEGISVTGASGGTIAFNDTVTTFTGVNNGITVTNSDTSVVRFTDIALTTTSGTGLSAIGSGEVRVTSAQGTNSITTDSGQALVLHGTNTTDQLTIGTGGVIIDTVDVAAGIGDSVSLQNLAGTANVRIGSGTNAGDGGTITTTGTAIAIDNANSVTVNNVIVNNTTGAGVNVTNQDGGSVALSGVQITTTTGDGFTVENNTDGSVATNQLEVTTADGNAVTVQGNTGGTYTFTDLVATTSGAGDAMVADNNDGATVSVNGMELTANGSGRGFVGTNKGTLAMTGDTSVKTNTGTAVELDDIVIGSAGAGFDTVDTTNATNGVLLTDLTGGTVTIGSGSAAGDGGTLTTTGDAIRVHNVRSAAITHMTTSSGAGNGLVIQNQTSTGDVSVTGLTTTTTTGTGILVQNNTGGTNTFTTTDVTATGAGKGVWLTNNPGATTSFNAIDISTTSGTGFEANTSGTVAATGANTITTTTGTGLVTNDVTIGTAGLLFNSVNVNGAANGITLTDSFGGQIRVGPAASTGIDGTGGTISATGDAIVVSGVTNAVFNDVTASTSGAGNHAVVVNHTSTALTDIVFNNLGVNDVAGNGNAVVVNDSGTGELDFIMRNSNIDTTDSGSIGFLFDTGNNSGKVDITLDNNAITAADAIAVSAVIDQGSGNVQFLMTSNTVANNSAGNAAARFNVTAGRVLNATIGGQGSGTDGNSFSNSNGAGTAFAMTANNAGATVNLDLRGNTAAGGAVDYILTQTLGSFGVVDRDDTFAGANNTGTVTNGGGTFSDLSSVQQVD